MFRTGGLKPLIFVLGLFLFSGTLSAAPVDAEKTGNGKIEDTQNLRRREETITTDEKDRRRSDEGVENPARGRQTDEGVENPARGRPSQTQKAPDGMKTQEEWTTVNTSYGDGELGELRQKVASLEKELAKVQPKSLDTMNTVLAIAGAALGIINSAGLAGLWLSMNNRPKTAKRTKSGTQASGTSRQELDALVSAVEELTERIRRMEEMTGRIGSIEEQLKKYAPPKNESHDAPGATSKVTSLANKNNSSTNPSGREGGSTISRPPVQPFVNPGEREETTSPHSASKMAVGKTFPFAGSGSELDEITRAFREMKEKATGISGMKVREDFMKKYSVTTFSCVNSNDRLTGAGTPPRFEVSEPDKSTLWGVPTKDGFLAVLPILSAYEQNAHYYGGMKEIFDSDYRIGSYKKIEVKRPALMTRDLQTIRQKGEISLS